MNRYLFLVAAALVCLTLAPATSFAETITVDTDDDQLNGDARCSLREGVEAANTNAAVSGCDAGDPGADTIEFSDSFLGVGIALTGDRGENQNAEGDLDVTESLTIQGFAFLTSNGIDRILDIRNGPDPVAVTLAQVELSGGDSEAGSGGAVRSSETDSVLSIQDSSFEDNSSQANGGAIYAAGDLLIENSFFLLNTAEDNGGAIDAKGDLSIQGVHIFGGIEDNTAGGNGGAIQSHGQTTLSETFISANTASGRGGALHVLGDLSVDGVEFTDNGRRSGTSQPRVIQGGAIDAVQGTSVTISDSLFDLNLASRSGGAISTPGDLSVTNTTFDSNEVPDGTGGAINAEAQGGRTIELEEVRLIRNSGGLGGAVSLLNFGESFPSQSGSVVTVEDSLLASNTGDIGGGLAVVSTPFTEATSAIAITNTTLAENRASTGGALAVLEATGSPATAVDIDLDHVTTVGNRASSLDGGISSQSAPISVRGSILAFNTADGAASNCDGDPAITSDGYNLESQDTCDFTGGGDLANTNPLLAPLPAIDFLPDNDGPTEMLGLYPGSPALNAIPALQCPPPPEDQRGVLRPVGARCDIGAFEGTVSGPTRECGGRSVTIEGTSSRDVRIGTPRRDVIAGAKSKDLLKGGRGSDVICGGTGSDELRGGRGRDTLIGGPGSDDCRGGPGRDELVRC